MKVSRIVTGIVSVALLAFVVGDVMGQDGGGRRGGDRGDRGGDRGGGFGGGRGGGFGGGRGGGPGGGQTQDPTFGLLQVEEVRAEIELMPDQEEALKKMADQARENRQRPDFDFRNASDEERTAFFEKMQKQAKERAEEMAAQLEEVLLPEQMERLSQLGVQVLGTRALTLDRVVKELGITDKQKEELAEVTSGMRDKMMEMMRGGGGGDRENLRDKMEEMRDSVQKDLLGVLSDEQQKKFEEMKGEPFDFPEGAGRGGGRGGPGGGGFGGGGRGGGRGGPGGGDRGGRGRGGDRQRPETE